VQSILPHIQDGEPLLINGNSERGRGSDNSEQQRRGSHPGSNGVTCVTDLDGTGAPGSIGDRHSSCHPQRRSETKEEIRLGSRGFQTSEDGHYTVKDIRRNSEIKKIRGPRKYQQVRAKANAPGGRVGNTHQRGLQQQQVPKGRPVSRRSADPTTNTNSSKKRTVKGHTIRRRPQHSRTRPFMEPRYIEALGVIDCTDGSGRWPECREDRDGIDYDVIITVRPAGPYKGDAPLHKQIVPRTSPPLYSTDRLGFRKRVHPELGPNPGQSEISVHTSTGHDIGRHGAGAVGVAGCRGLLKMSFSANVGVYLNADVGNEGPCRIKDSEHLSVTYGKWEEDSESDSEIEWGSYLEEPVDSRHSSTDSCDDEAIPALQANSSPDNEEEEVSAPWYDQCSPCPTPNLSVYQTAEETSTDEEQYLPPRNPTATFRRTLSDGASFTCDQELSKALAKIRTQYTSSESGDSDKSEKNFV